ncbi:DMT family transporter [Shimia sediminis]|uniref:DMT family transporter n=1 Tax=Shimia sediminis TaxID=2497945 RepID=UPI000F8C83D6|nr:DMT family transporter [Shimia sediminis]
MTRRQLVFYTLVLIGMGTGWGLTQPLAKIAVSTGYQQFGLIFWQLVIGVTTLGSVTLITGRSLPLTAPALRLYVIIALIGTIIPNGASFKALVHIPSGVQSVLMSLVPMAAFPIALMLSLERFQMRRLSGLALGLAGVLLLVLPEASLPDRAAVPWMALTLVAVLCYAFEGNFVARWGLGGLDPIQVLFGASVVGAVITLPLALGTGQFISPLRPFGAAEWALVASSVIHAVIYASYVWLVGRAGSVFASQVGYAVTATGVIWAMLILNESYSPWFWAAAGLILGGVFLVQPKQKETLAP